MKALGKILGLVLLGLLLLIVALGFALTHLFDPNDYKDEIRQLARDKANLELTLNGDIGWSLFPWLGLQLHDATLASAQTPDQPFADLRMLGLSVRVMPLLRKEVQMSDIKIDGLRLTLNRDEQGHGNWEQLGRQPATTAEGIPPTEPADTTAATASPGGDLPIKLDIDSLTLSNARIDYHDAKSGLQLTAEGIELSTGAIREGASIPLKLTAFLGTNQPVMRASTLLKGELRFDRALQRYQFEDLQLSGEAAGEPLDGKTLTFAAQGQLLLDRAAQVAEWNGLKLSANQVRALGEIKLRDLDSAPKLSGGLSLAQFNLREFLESLGQTLPPMSDAKALSQVELVTRLVGSPTSLSLDELTLKLDDSTLTGSLGISDFSKRALRVQLKGNHLDLDRYLPKSEPQADSARKNEVRESVAAAGQSGTSPLPEAPSQQAWSDKALIPLDALRQLDVQLGLSFDLLTFNRLPLENLQLKAQSKAGLASLDSLRGELHGGALDVSARLDGRPDVPLLTLKQSLSRIPVEKVLRAQGEKPPLKGLLDLNAELSSRGISQKSWVENLNGRADFVLSDGVLLDANLEQQLCQGIATLNRKTLGTEVRGSNTPFEELKGSLSVIDGVAHNPDLKARIPGLTVNGEGDLDLRVLGLDYRVGIVIEGDKGAMPDPACEVNPRYAGIAWPLRCRGPLELGAKACRLDNERMGKVAAKLVGDKLSEKLEEKLGDKVSPELKDALKGLFNQ
ncbi:MAG: AsmA family protein [Pseudomonas sp.]|uniref:AsmA family protein n=1 Tax=Pseudomonas sp. TaxID=306 RepID=UPI003399D1F4